MSPSEPEHRAPNGDAISSETAAQDREAHPVAAKGKGRRKSADVPKTLAVWIATAGGVGFGPWAPGTWGALVAVIAFGLGLGQLPIFLYLFVVVAVRAVGVVASPAAEGDFASHDDGRIVIDEVAGQLVTLAPLVPLWATDLGSVDLSLGLFGDGGALVSGGGALLSGGGAALSEGGALLSEGGAALSNGGAATFSLYSLLVVTGFVAFRWFDIRKPGRVRWAERRFEAGAGVMADDLVAGVYGAVVVSVLAYVALVARGGLS